MINIKLNSKPFNYNNYIGDLFSLEEFTKQIENRSFVWYDGSVGGVIINGEEIDGLKFDFNDYPAGPFSKKIVLLFTLNGGIIDGKVLQQFGKVEIRWCNK